MKKKYAFHPNNYAIGATEKYYTDMAAKGWELETHGAYLSKFKKAEPKRTLYRVELIPQKFFPKEDEQIPNREQLAIFKDCGWTYVSGASSVHVFSAPEGTNAPEFYLEPEQQAPIVKKVRNFNIYYFLLFFSMIFTIPIMAIMFGDSLSEIFSELYYLIIYSSKLELISIIFTSIYVVSILAHFLILILKYNCLYRQLKNGIPIDHSPAKKAFHFPAALLALVSVIITLIFLTLNLIFPKETHTISTTHKNPSITLSDASIEISEMSGYYGHYIEYSKAALSENWYCEEYVNVIDNNDVKIIQDIYQLKYDFLCESFANALMAARTYTVDPEDFVEVEIQGLDKAWLCENICIVIKDDFVYLIRYYNDSEDDMTSILQAIADKNYE